MDKQRIDVFISSTSIDLPEHRAAVRDAIITLGMHPSGMEHWPVRGENPVDLCRSMVADAEIYLGIYAHRYGWRPAGFDGRSITELEYDWAGETQRDGKPIPRLCFIMADSHPWPKDRMELDALDDLNRFKARVRENQVGFFSTPDDLKAQVIAALAPYAPQTGGRAALPYLRWLHEQSRSSGLLRVLRPRDAASGEQTVTVDQVYTPLDTRQTVTRDRTGRLLPGHEIMERKRGGEIDDKLKQTSLTAMEAASLFPHLVLLGDPGSGKSTFLDFLALCLTGQAVEADDGWLARLEEQGWQHGEKLPVVVTLRDFAQDVPSGITSGAARLLFEHIERQLARWKLEAALPVIRAALDAGRALVMLDGLDEVPPEKRDLVRDTIGDFIIRCHADTRFIVTCRILSYANPDWRIPNTVEQTIAPFDEEKVEHFIGAWYTALKALRQIDDETAQQRVADLTTGLRHPHLQDIASNPMLLTVMAVVHNHTGTLPRESAKLYDQCVELLMMRWKPAEARSLMETLNVREDDLYRMLWEIAYDAHDKQAEREGAADISEAAVLGIARKRLGDTARAAEFCEYVEKRAGLLIGRGQDAYGMRVFAFPHRTFQEFLAGCHVAAERFTRRVPELARRGAGWREALLLATGHLVFNRGDIATPLDAINAVCPERHPPQTDEDWRATWLAGDMLALIGLTNVTNDEVGREVLPRLQERLAELVAGGHLTPVERAAAGRALAALGDPRPGVGVVRLPSPSAEGAVGRGAGGEGILLPDIAWVEIPAGTFQMGGDPDAWDARKGGRFDIPYTFWMAKYPVTYAQYEAFVADDGYLNRDYWTAAGWQWRGEKTQPEIYWNDPTWHIGNHPVVGVTWYEAYAYTRWLDAKYREAGGVERFLPSPQTPLPTAPSALGEGLRGLPLTGEYRAKANEVLVQIARELRQRETAAEDLLWECLRNRRLANLKFRRQHPVANTPYVVDFFCYDHRLVIELDGGIHSTQREDDARRQAELEAQGLRVLRFPNDLLYTHLEDVLTTIIQTALSASPLLAQRSGEGAGVRAEIRLPTEAEWEKAARGTEGLIYPYGNEFDPAKGNTDKTGIGQTSAVGLFPDGASPYGVLDMSGNVWEWCLTAWAAEYRHPGANDAEGIAARVLCGGWWNSNQAIARAASRLNHNPIYRGKSRGFRVVVGCPI